MCATSQAHAIDDRLSPARHRVNMIEFKKSTCLAAASPLAHEGALTLIPFPNSAANVGGDVMIPDLGVGVNIVVLSSRTASDPYLLSLELMN